MENKRSKRPTIISVIGILNIVFGSLGLATVICCVGPGLIMGQFAAQMPMPKAQGQPQMENPLAAMNAIPGYIATQCAQIGMGSLTGGLLLVSGIGFMKMKPWARTTAMIYSIIAMLWGVAAWIIQQKFVNPGVLEMTKKIQAQAGPNAPPNPMFSESYMNVVATLGLMVSFAYPVTLLILILLPAVKYGLAGKVDPAWQPPEEPLDGGIESDDTAER